MGELPVCPSRRHGKQVLAAGEVLIGSLVRNAQVPSYFAEAQTIESLLGDDFESLLQASFPNALGHGQTDHIFLKDL
jgi:hypothetical protein